MKRNLVYILFFIGFITYAQQNPVSVEVDTASIKIGEQIQYKISVNEVNNVLFPKLELDSLGKVEIVEDLPIDTIKNRLEKKYLITSFDSGVYVIPQQEIRINNSKFLADSLLINVATVKVDTTKQKMFEIKSIKREPKTFNDYKPWLWWIIPIVLLIALVLFLIFRKKVKKPKVKIQIPPIQEALQRLKELDEKQLVQQNKIKFYYSELTDIVRTYIEKDIKIPALESTTNELIETITDFNESSKLGISKETLNQLKIVLESADLVKFAKSKPIAEEIKGDRLIVEDILKNTQTAVFTKQNEAQIASKTSIENNFEIPVAPVKKKNNILKYILIAIGVLTIVFGILGYFGYQYLKQNVIGATTSEMMNKQWYTSSYGNPAIVIQTPEILKVKSVNLPANRVTNIGDFAHFEYGSMVGDFYIGLSTINFISEMDNFNFDGAVQGGLAQIEATIGSKVTNVKTAIIDFNGIEGREVTANFKSKNKLTQKEASYKITMVIYADKNALQQVSVVYLENEKSAEKVKDRILKSVSINR